MESDSKLKKEDLRGIAEFFLLMHGPGTVHFIKLKGVPFTLTLHDTDGNFSFTAGHQQDLFRTSEPHTIN